MILGIIAMGILVGGISAYISLQAGYSVIAALAVYSGCGALSVLIAGGIVFAVSEMKCRLSAVRQKPEQAHQADAAV